MRKIAVRIVIVVLLIPVLVGLYRMNVSLRTQLSVINESPGRSTLANSGLSNSIPDRPKHQF